MENIKFREAVKWGLQIFARNYQIQPHAKFGRTNRLAYVAVTLFWHYTAARKKVLENHHWKIESSIKPGPHAPATKSKQHCCLYSQLCRLLQSRMLQSCLYKQQCCFDFVATGIRLVEQSLHIILSSDTWRRGLINFSFSRFVTIHSRRRRQTDRHASYRHKTQLYNVTETFA